MKSAPMIRWFYSFILYLATPVFLARLWWRSQQNPDYRKRIFERFGFFKAPNSNTPFWIHSVSVGEVIAAAPLIQALLRAGHRITVTTTTPTGSARLRALCGEQVFHVYLPYDLPCAIQRFIAHIQPKQLILMETELWPNLLHYAHQAGIRIVLANARLSARSAARYQKIQPFTRIMLQKIASIAAQHEQDAQRFIALGARFGTVSVMGNLKYDLHIPDDLRLRAEKLRAQLGANRPIWVAGSTHAGEENAIIAAHQAVKQILPHALLLWAPRHPERSAEIMHLCKEHNLTVQLRSQLQEDPLQIDAQVLIIDTLGELILCYAASDIAFVGGSLTAHGGHNVLEPAAVGRPVLTGPHVFNFSAITTTMVDAGAAYYVHNAIELAQQILQFFQNKEVSHQAGQAGLQVIEENRGALEKLLRMM